MDHTTVLITTNLVTLLIGGALGFALTWLMLDLEFVRKKLVTEETPMATDTTTAKTESTTRKRRGFRLYPDAIVVALVLGLMANTVIAQISTNRATHAVTCLEDYANDLADALDRRTTDNTDLADADEKRDLEYDQLIGMLLLDPPPTDEEFKEAIEDVVTASGEKTTAKDRLDEGRKAKSYPQAPREVCKS